MGMYDTVEFTCPCPKCGEIVDSFQSKDRYCLMERLKPYQVRGFYSYCNKCKTWIEFKTVGFKEYYNENVEYKLVKEGK